MVLGRRVESPTDPADITLKAMGRDDMKLGARYVTSRGLTVTYLETSEDVRGAGRVTVRFEDGLLGGDVRELGVRSIVRPVDAADLPQRRKRKPPPVVFALNRKPRVGDTTLRRGSLFEWTVTAIDADGKATVTTRIFDQPRTDTVPLQNLRVVVPNRSAGPLAELWPIPPKPAPPKPAALVAVAVADYEEDDPGPDDPVGRLMARVTFTEGCLNDASNRLGIPKREVLDFIRDEARNRGKVVRVPGRPEEYVRVRVPGRFDVPLPREAQSGADFDVERLEFRGARRGREQRQSQSSALRRHAA